MATSAGVRITNPTPVAGAATTYQWEPFEQLRDDGWDKLLERHWREIAINRDTVPLDPDWEKYEALERLGQWRVFTGRRDGAIVAYLAWFCHEGLHYRQTTFYESDVFYVDRPFRGGMTGVRLYRESMRGFKRPSIVHARAKLHAEEALRVGKLLERLGFTQVEVLYSLRLD